MRNAVVLLLDSLNRHFLHPYAADPVPDAVLGLGAAEVDTPNLDRFAARATRFTNHFSGSLPCMPARHDLLVGSLDFLWRPWGSIEIWEQPITTALRAAGVTTKLISDHPHLFETGGENYHCDFTAWQYERGHEGDPWKTRPDPTWLGAPSFGRGHTPYDNSRGWFRGEADFPGPRTMAAAASWLTHHAPHHDRFLLFVDEFDPHEPFDTPEPYASRYDPGWEGPHLIWPPYKVGAMADGTLSARDARQVRASYASKLSMIDHWLGKVFDALDATDRWADTAVIVCTDHGHYLGERDVWGKPSRWLQEPLVHTPLFVWWPERPAGAPRTIDALTTNVDLHATLADLFGATDRLTHPTHGASLVPLLNAQARGVRDWALAGVWGREVHALAGPGVLDDGVVKYARAPMARNEPLSMWSNRWSTMPVHSRPDVRLPLPDDRAVLDRMPGSSVPVIRQPFGVGDPIPFWGYGPFTGHHLHRVSEDPNETDERADGALEGRAVELLRSALDAVGAPQDQYVRLGI